MAAWVPMLVSIVAIGVYPKIVTGAANDAVQALMDKAF